MLKYSRRIHADLAREPVRAAAVSRRQDYRRTHYREMMKSRATHVAQVTAAIEYAIRTERTDLADWVY